MDAAEDHRHTLVRADLVADREQAGQAGGAGGAGVDRRVLGRQPGSLAARRTRGRRSASRPSPACRRRRRASRRSRRRGCRRRRSTAPCPTATSGSTHCAAAPRRPAASTARSQARFSGAHPSVCTAWRIGAPPGSASRRRGADTRGERSPADLHDDAIERATGAVDRRLGLTQHLPADRAATVEAPHVLRALHAERHGARRHRLAKPVHARIAGRIAGSTRADDDLRRQRREPSDDALARRRRHEHPDRPRRRGSQRRCRQRGVAARRDGQRRPTRRRTDAAGHGASPMRSAVSRCSRIVNRWRALWLPATLAVSSLIHTPPVGGEAERVRESVRAGERRPPEPGAGDRRDRGVGLRDQRDRAPAPSSPRAAANASHASARPEGEERIGVVTVVGTRCAAPRRRSARRGADRARRSSGSATTAAWRCRRARRTPRSGSRRRESARRSRAGRHPWR